MNLFAVLNRGVDLSGSRRRLQAVESRRERELREAISRTRAQWKNALLVDQTRAWMAVSSAEREVLTGLVSVLTLAGLARAHDDGHADSLTVRLIRGAISAADQCASTADCVISALDATAFSSAARAAIEAIDSCTDAAIAHAADYLHRLVRCGAGPSPFFERSECHA